MTFAELAEYWWLLLVLLMVICCFRHGSCCRGSGRRARDDRVGPFHNSEH